MASIYDFTVLDIRQQPVPLTNYRDKVLLVVNVASRCMYTKQYSELQALYEQYRGRGFEILGFPCDQFGHQEPGTGDEIQSFCSTSFAITFPLFDKIEVNGADAAPVYKYLKAAAPGLLGTEAIKWNFSKFLISRDGQKVTRFAPRITPKALASDIERLLPAAAQHAVAP